MKEPLETPIDQREIGFGTRANRILGVAGCCFVAAVLRPGIEGELLASRMGIAGFSGLLIALACHWANDRVPMWQRWISRTFLLLGSVTVLGFLAFVVAAFFVQDGIFAIFEIAVLRFEFAVGNMGLYAVFLIVPAATFCLALASARANSWAEWERRHGVWKR